jgi:uncharacterized membrane protein (UPF0127 family)
VNLDALATDLATERGLRWLWVGVWVLFALGMGACLSKGADRPADPALQDASRVPGFAEIGFSVKDGSGNEQSENCALLADTDTTRSQGLMNRADLAGYDGMVFRYQDDVTFAFHMRNTPLPLSIAWFDSHGKFVSSTDMEPCLERDDCPIYRAERAYRTAIEVKRGGLPGLRIGPDSTIHVGGTCG